MHVELGGYHVRDLLPVAAFDVDQAKVGTDLARPSTPGSTTPSASPRVGEFGVTVQRGPSLRQPRQVLPRGPRGVAGRAGRRGPGPTRRAGRRASVLFPVGSEQAQRHYAQACLDAGVAFVNAIPVFIASDPGVGTSLPRRRRAHRRRRHQEPGRLHDRPPHSDPPLRGPRPGPGPHLPAQLRREHGLQEHARARPGSSPRRSPRPQPSPARSRTTCSTPTTSTSAVRTMSRG